MFAKRISLELDFAPSSRILAVLLVAQSSLYLNNCHITDATNVAASRCFIPKEIIMTLITEFLLSLPLAVLTAATVFVRAHHANAQ